MLTLVQLETFIEIYYAGSFVKASKKLNATQSTVTKRIQELESFLGESLIIRKQNRSKIELTKTGKKLLKHAIAVVDAKKLLIDEMIVTDEQYSNIRIGCAETLIYLKLSDAIKKFNTIYPDVNISVEVANSVRLKRLLLREDIDLAFMMGPPTEKNIVSSHLYSSDMAFYASENLGTKFIPIEKLVQRGALITFDSSTIPSKDLVSLLSKFNLENARLHYCSSLHSIVEMTRKNIGIGLIPTAVAKPYVKNKTLFEVNTIKVEQLHFYSCYLHDNKNENFLNLFIKSYSSTKI